VKSCKKQEKTSFCEEIIEIGGSVEPPILDCYEEIDIKNFEQFVVSFAHVLGCNDTYTANNI